MKLFRGLGAVAVAAAMLVAGCNGGGDDGGDADAGAGTAPGVGVAPDAGASEGILMVTPYVSESDMGPINEAFSTSAASPWGFEHRGVDFFSKGHFVPFRAVAAGVIAEVKLNENEGSGNWQVSVRLDHASDYWVLYVFEPMTDDQRDGQTQLDSISVTEGQQVSQGETIGDLYGPGDGAHVHFGLYRTGGADVCPEPHFVQEAKDSIVRLIREQWPQANMCYQD